MKILLIATLLLFTSATYAQSKWTYVSRQGAASYEIYDAQYVFIDGHLTGNISFWLRTSLRKKKSTVRLVKGLYVANCDSSQLILVAGGLSGSFNVVLADENNPEIIVAKRGTGFRKALEAACEIADDELFDY